ncbi:MAG TPA: archaetidylserine decarboxylase [Anaeromyxobacteraceae bacterium]|nr:archaetidylserine decarboxylase [Anaeromyxobacteraceae bacterium]
MNDRLFIGALRLLPKNALSRLVGRLTDAALPGWLLRPAMRSFARRYRIDLAECPPLETYPTFGRFFARPLLPGRRPVAPGDGVVVSPVDGVVSETGLATAGRMIQAKGIDYRVGALLADPKLAGAFEGGAWATIYLSPQDYHRIHFPLGGRVTGWRYVPGELWPVNAASVRRVPGLFTVNERLVTVQETPLGRVAVVAVGATVVGRVRAAYDHGVPTTDQPGADGVRGHDYEAPLPVEKGAELGAFEMGSTVILLFEPGRVRLDPRLVPGARVRVGEAIGAA